MSESSCIPGSHGTVAIRQMVPNRLSRHCTDSRLRHTCKYSVKKTSLLVLEFQPERQDTGLAHGGASGADLKEHKL